MIKLGIPITPRLAAALECGSTRNLHRLLITWDQAEIRALHTDMHAACEAGMAELTRHCREAINGGGYPPEIAALYDEQRSQLVEFFMEFHEVLRFYLDTTPEPKEKLQ